MRKACYKVSYWNLLPVSVLTCFWDNIKIWSWHVLNHMLTWNKQMWCHGYILATLCHVFLFKILFQISYLKATIFQHEHTDVVSTSLSLWKEKKNPPPKKNVLSEGNSDIKPICSTFALTVNISQYHSTELIIGSVCPSPITLPRKCILKSVKCFLKVQVTII